MSEDVRSATKPMSSAGVSQTARDLRTTNIAIIGAGIAGLYCGLKLADKRDFRIFEESDHLGGRIWSTRILANGVTLKDGDVVSADSKVEFWAEFGPMRIELELQHRLNDLLEELYLKDDLVKFPPYESPTSPHDPKYELQGEEGEQKTPLDLLQLAMARIIGRLICRYTAEDLRSQGKEKGEAPARPSPEPGDTLRVKHLEKQLRRGVYALCRSAATRQPDWKIFFIEWIRTLDELDYQNLREYGAFDDGTTHADGSKGTALWNMGFWNLLSEVLSHHAVMKIRDLGTFYHLIPENPNAAEWLIFWLRAFRTSEQLVGVRDGMQRITERMASRIDPDWRSSNQGRILKGFKLLSIAIHGLEKNQQDQKKPQDEKKRLKLTFRNANTGDDEHWLADHVILALPRGPLEKLARANPDVLCNDALEDIKGVLGFPLLKFFVLVKKRWWNEDATRTNRYATHIPTRELHYRASPVPGSTKGLILVYTDRPASGFWSNYIRHEPPEPAQEAQPPQTSDPYILSGTQNQPEQGDPRQNVRLINKALQYLKAYGVTLQPDDIQFYGIRDWGREPYRGAAHAWYPERKSWEIVKRLSAFAPGDVYHNCEPGDKVLHICGEAYSDYQAFIEGALRSADHVLHTIDRDVFARTPTPWLCDEACFYPTAAEERDRLRDKKPCRPIQRGHA